MEIIQDEVGRKLVVAETTPRLPLAVFLAGLGLVILVAAPWRWLWSMLVHGIDPGSAELMSSGVWLLVGLLLLSSLLTGKRLERFAVDRDSARIEWRSSHFAGLPGFRQHLDLAALEALTLELMPTRKGVVQREAKGGLPLRLTLRAGSGPVRLDLRIAPVSRVSEIADFGLRLGASGGLPFYRVAGNDPQQFAIELLRSAGPDVQPVPDFAAPADYARDAVGAAALDAVSRERLPRFDPEAFKGSPGLVVWAPGREVRFEKTWGLTALLTPLMLAGLAGPFAWLRLPSLHAIPVLPRVGALGLITFSGLGIAVIGWLGLESGLPRGALLDWGSRSLVVKRVRKRRTIAFSQIVAIELLTRAYRGRVGYRQYYMSYCCEVRAVVRTGASASAPLLLTETRSYREDPVTPRLMALPLVTELSSSLGVERRTPGVPHPGSGVPES